MKCKWEKSTNEKKAESEMEDYGFNIIEVKQYISKTKYKVSKEGVEYTFEVYTDVSNIKNYMRLVFETFEMKQEIMAKENRVKELSE